MFIVSVSSTHPNPTLGQGLLSIRQGLRGTSQMEHAPTSCPCVGSEQPPHQYLHELNEVRLCARLRVRVIDEC